MADKDETQIAPKPPARRAPRKTAATKSAGGAPAASDKPARKPRAKPERPAAATSSEGSSTKATSHAAASRRKPAAPPKPRSTKRATPPTKRSPKQKSGAAGVATEKKAGWNKAAIAGGLAAVGAAATAALLSLRSSSPRPVTGKTDDKEAKPLDPATSNAHTPEGEDATKSLKAGIADQNTIPE